MKKQLNNNTVKLDDTAKQALGDFFNECDNVISFEDYFGESLSESDDNASTEPKTTIQKIRNMIALTISKVSLKIRTSVWAICKAVIRKSPNANEVAEDISEPMEISEEEVAKIFGVSVEELREITDSSKEFGLNKR